MAHHHILDSLSKPKARLARSFYLYTRHWPWELSSDGTYWSQGLLARLIRVARHNKVLDTDFDVFKAKIRVAIRDRLAKNGTKAFQRVQGLTVHDLDQFQPETERARRARRRQRRSERNRVSNLDEIVTDDGTEDGDSTDGSVYDSGQDDRRSMQQDDSGAKVVQQQNTDISVQDSTAPPPTVMLTTEVDNQQGLNIEHAKQESCDSRVTPGFTNHTRRTIYSRESMSPHSHSEPPTQDQRTGASPPTIRTKAYEQVLRRPRSEPPDGQPQPIQIQLEARLQPASSLVSTMLAGVAEDATKEQKKARIALKHAEADLAALRRELETASGVTDKAARSAEAELANATIEADKAEEAFRHLEACFVPQNDAEKAVIDQRAADAAAARKRRDAAAASLNEARCGRGGDANNSITQLEERQTRLIASAEECRGRLQALVQEGKAVKVFQSVIQLGPAQFYHMLRLSQLAFPLEAVIQKYVDEFNVGPAD